MSMKNLFSGLKFGTRKREAYLRFRENGEGVSVDICIGEYGSFPRPVAECSREELEDFAPLLLLADKLRDTLHRCNGRLNGNE